MKLSKYKLGDLVEVTRGMSLSGQYYAKEGKLVRLTLGNFNLNGGGFKENTSKSDLYFTGEVKDEYLLKKGDIITPLTEQTIGLLGSTARIPISGRYIQSQDVALVRCKEGKMDSNFCYYLISSNLVRQQLSAAAQQTKIRHTSPDKIKNCTVYVPPLDCQKNIGNFLTEVDKLIAFNEAINHNLEAMAKQLYEYWFVQFDFPDENGRPYKSSGGKMVWNEKLKREIPEGWSVTLLSNVAEVRKGETITAKEATKGNIKVVAGGINFSYYNGVCNRPKNTITISGSGANAGYINFWREPIFASDCSTVNCIDDLDTILCWYTLKLYQEVLYNFAVGAAQPHVYPNHVSNLPILVIPKHIKEKVRSFYCFSNDRMAKNEFEINILTKLRDELLPLLMNGQVSVNYDL